jgi:hypothetical protein
MRITQDYISTFGLTEGKSTSVMHERAQISVNSTGVLFMAQGTSCVKLHLYPLQPITIITQIIMADLLFKSVQPFVSRHVVMPKFPGR